jgi:Ni/Co efflux regulator RcnB
MVKSTLPILAVLALAAPSMASAEIVRADLRGDAVALIKIDHKEKHRGKGHGRGHGRGDEHRAYDQGFRDGQREAYRRFSRGERLPYEYRDQVLYQYDDYGYPPPPYGSRYVQVGQDTYLMQAATGLILQAFTGRR